MNYVFVYAVPFLSMVYAALAHRRMKIKFWLPSLVAATSTGATALLFYILLGKSGASYLYVLLYATITGFVMAVLIGFLMKHASKWFR